MHRSRLLVALALLGGIVAAGGAWAETGARPAAIGEPVADFTAEDLDGESFRLSEARSLTEEEALRAVTAAFADAKEPVDRETTLVSVKALQGSGNALDPAARTRWLREVGRPFGLLVDDATGEDFETVGDVADWLVAAQKAPIVFVFWSPMCGASKKCDARMREVVASTGARLYVFSVPSRPDETAEHVRKYVREHDVPYRVLFDHDLAMKQHFGASKTCHFLVLDAKNVLRYSGAADDDIAEEKPAAQRQQWLRNAIVAIRADKPVDVLMTTPKG